MQIRLAANTDGPATEKFNVDKYKTLVGGGALGLQFIDLIDTRWSEWLDIVETAPWIGNWRRSRFYKSTTTTTPLGRSVETPLPNHYAVAPAIFADAVWGFGLRDWLKDAAGKVETCGNFNAPMRTILQLQRVRCPSAYRTYFWDLEAYQRYGLHLPCELGDLDRWLEPLWYEARELFQACS